MAALPKKLVIKCYKDEAKEKTAVKSSGTSSDVYIASKSLSVQVSVYNVVLNCIPVGYVVGHKRKAAGS